VAGDGEASFDFHKNSYWTVNQTSCTGKALLIVVTLAMLDLASRVGVSGSG
jgi:hypothetical protein